MEINLRYFLSKVEYLELCEEHKEGETVVVSIGVCVTKGKIKRINDDYYLVKL